MTRVHPDDTSPSLDEYDLARQLTRLTSARPGLGTEATAKALAIARARTAEAIENAVDELPTLMFGGLVWYRDDTVVEAIHRAAGTDR